MIPTIEVSDIPKVGQDRIILSVLSDPVKEHLLSVANTGKKIPVCLRVGKRRKLKKVFVYYVYNTCTCCGSNYLTVGR